MKDYILKAENVCYYYSDGTFALQSINVNIEKGKKTVFLGSNGAGKSTLFLHMNGILKPSKGKIFFNNKEIDYSRKGLTDLRKNVGIVFQDPDSQLFSASVLQEVSFGPMNLGLSKEQVEERVHKALEATGITELKDKPTHFLSYGQKKRVTIADIVAMEPEVIIFDEPTEFLDPKHKAQIISLLEEINKKGKTVILSTHDVDMAYTWADHVIVMKHGQVLKEGTPEEIFSDKQVLIEADLVSPWILEIYNLLRNEVDEDKNICAPRTKEELVNFICSSICPRNAVNRS